MIFALNIKSLLLIIITITNFAWFNEEDIDEITLPFMALSTNTSYDTFKLNVSDLNETTHRFNFANKLWYHMFSISNNSPNYQKIENSASIIMLHEVPAVKVINQTGNGKECVKLKFEHYENVHDCEAALVELLMPLNSEIINQLNSSKMRLKIYMGKKHISGNYDFSTKMDLTINMNESTQFNQIQIMNISEIFASHNISTNSSTFLMLCTPTNGLTLSQFFNFHQLQTKGVLYNLPSLAIYYKGNRSSHPAHTEISRRILEFRLNATTENRSSNTRSRSKRFAIPKEYCQKIPFTIDPHLLLMNGDTCVMPRHFTILACTGSCDVPLVDVLTENYLNFSREAMISQLQSSYNKRGIETGQQLPKPNCVPLQFHNIKYVVHSYTNTLITYYLNISSSTCGCI